MKAYLRAVVALGLFVGVTGHARADYIFTTLDVPGSTQTTAYGINSAGQVVGDYLDARGFRHGFLLTNGSYTTLDVQGPGYTQALGLNNVGQIVGSYIDSLGVQHGFLLSGGIYTLLDVPRSWGGTLSGPFGIMASGINDRAQIVGSYMFTTNLRPPMNASGAFLLSGGVYTEISEPNAPGGSAATGINNASHIVGGGGAGSFILSNGTYMPLAVPDPYNTLARGINDADDIVGTYQDGTDHVRGFLLSDGILTFIEVPGAATTEINGINNAGDLVGSYVDARGVTHAFEATPVPELPTLLLLGIGILCMVARAYCRRLSLA
jgi:probable HAF family extracellular repeat protein